MEDAGAYPAALEEALARVRPHIEKTVLPGLVESVRLFQVTYDGMLKLMLKKGLVREDPYRHDAAITEPAIPSTEWFELSELPEQMGIRLAQLHDQLDFLLGDTRFSAEELRLPRIKLLVGLVRYIDYANLSETSAHVPTAAFATLLARLTKGPDAVAAAIAKDGVSHLADFARRILKLVAELQLYQRESYKLALRRSAIPASTIDASSAAADSGAVLTAISAAARASGLPFYPELAAELLAEDYPENPAAGAELRSQILARLQLQAKAESRQQSAAPSPREGLLDALGGLGSTETSLRSALRCIRDNEALVRSKRLTTLRRFRRFILRFAGVKEKPKTYAVELMDEAGGGTKVEHIAYAAFLEEASAKAKVLQELASRSGAAYQRLHGAPEDEIYDFLTARVAELQLLLRRLEGLSTLFRSMVPPSHRGMIRGIHGDLSLVLAALSRANKLRHEYVATREEEAQLRKLGLPPQK